MSQNQFKPNVPIEDIINLFIPRHNPEGLVKKLLTAVGLILTPITLIGALWFYVLSYKKHMQQKGLEPVLDPILPVTRVSMIVGSVFVWLVVLVSFGIMAFLFNRGIFSLSSMLGYLFINLIITSLSMFKFNQWRYKVSVAIQNSKKHGTARLAELSDYRDLFFNTLGIYVGLKEMIFAAQGHLLSVAGPASGKFTNLIAQNLLGKGGNKKSWFVIDIKGEIFSVTARYQRSQKGRKVIVLNPWNLHQKSESTFNPLDLVNINDEESLVDDTLIIAQMIVPDQPGDKDPYWRNRSRSWIKGMIIHIMLGGGEKTLTTVWNWLRLPEEQFADLLEAMSKSPNEVVKGTANEILNMKSNEKGYSSVLSSAQDATDFLSSPALQRSLKTSNFDINELSNGMTTIYVVIPADKLESHAQWMRLVVTSSLLSVVRNKNKRVVFLLDEFAQLGNMEIVKRYMGLSRGYNINIWMFLQSLQQLKGIYGEAWETFIGATAVRHYFGINDNFTADYVSKSCGVSTFQSGYTKGNQDAETGLRPLITADEVKRVSADNMILQIDQRYPYIISKMPYYEDVKYKDSADKNPYYEDQTNDENQDL